MAAKVPDVEAAQKEINEWRKANGHKEIKVTGTYDADTEKAVKDFQQATGVKEANVMGRETRDRLTLENDPNFKNLPDPTKTHVREQMNNYFGKDPDSRERLKQIATDPNFAKLSPDFQSDALRKYANNPTEKSAKSIQEYSKDLASLESNDKFKALGDVTKKSVRESMKKNWDYPTARERLTTLSTDPNFGKLGAANQDRALKALAFHSANISDLQKIIGSESFQKMDEGLKARTLELAAKDPEAKDYKYSNGLANLTSDPKFGALKGHAKDTALQAFENHPANAANLQKMIQSDSFQKMDEGLKTRTLNLAMKNPESLNPRYMDQLTKLTSDPKFGALHESEKTKTLNVFENVTPKGRDALQGLLQRQINGIPAITSRGLGNTGPLLDQLERISTAPSLDARLTDRTGAAADKKLVAEQLLEQVSDPNNYIHQSTRSTCTCTSISHRLAMRNPAEYARITTDLAMTGQSKLANGDTISVPDTGAWQGSGAVQDTRTHTERLIQSSLMNYARPGKTYQNHNNGPNGVFGGGDDGFIDPSNPGVPSPDGWPDRPGSGLSSDEEKRVMKGLYGRNYDFYTGTFLNFQGGKDDIMDKLKSELKAGRGPINSDLKWSNGGHAVEVTEIKNGRVYIRNPWGPGAVGPNGQVNGTSGNNWTNGGQWSGPNRRVEDSASGLESMTIQDYKNAVRGIYVQD